jgi:O-antigen/teichoic acid export membrane protein
VGPIVRLGLTLAAFSIGLHVGGAMLATLLSMMVALLLPMWVLRTWVAPTPSKGRRLNRRDAFRSLLPVMVGLLAIAALTSDDVVVAKAVMSEHGAGIYGSASLIGRVVLYLPAAIITVLLPRVAARAAGQRDARDLLLKSVSVTAGFCISVTLLYAIAPDTIVRTAFGERYADAAPLLWRFGVAMTVYAILNVLLVYHLGRGRSAMSWLLAAGAALQIVAFMFFHRSANELVTVDVVFAVGLVVAHEVFIDRTFARMASRH